MAKRKRSKFIKRLAIFGGILIVVQLVFIFVLSKDEAVTVREAINRAVSGADGISPERREQLRIQLALQDHMMVNGGVPPQYLDALVPKYFDSIPINPTTNKPFPYKVENGRPFVGEQKTPIVVAGEGAPTDPNGAVLDKFEQIAMLDKEKQENSYVYDSTGKRDPFQPFSFAPIKEEMAGKTPLERYDIGQLKLTAVLQGFAEPRAIVENSAGKGFTVKKGAKIGTNNGEVVEIQKDKLLVLESSTDFTGKTTTRTVEMKLRTPDQNRDQ